MILYQTENFGKHRDYRSNPHKNWVVPPHIHAYTEIAFTTAGVTTVYLDGTRYTLPKDHVIFILPNRIHEYPGETPSEMRCAVFSEDHVPFFFEEVNGRIPLSPVLDLSDSPELLRALAETAPHESLRLSGLLALLCDKLLSSSEFVEAPTGAHSLLYAVTAYISENFRRDIHLSDLSKKLGYHEKYLSSVLHAETNMNFRTFLASYRVNYAKHLLRGQSGDGLRISDVALQSGFSSINSFNRSFRAVTGTTPSAYARSAAIRGGTRETSPHQPPETKGAPI